MDWLTALLGGAGSLISGWMGANAANQSAAEQAKALQAAIDFQTNNVNQAGTANREATSQALGLQGAATGKALGRINSAITNSINRSNQARNQSVAEQTAATERAVGTQQGFYNTARSDIMPWMQAGQQALQQYSGELGLTSGPDGQPFQSQFRTTPGYEFQVQEGEKAAVNNLRSLGMGGSGAALKALTSFRTGLADQTYNQYLSNLKGVADSGQNATAGLGQLGAQTGSNIGTTLMNGAGANANSRFNASGQANNAAMSGATAIGNILSNGASSAGTTIMNGATNLGDILVRGGEGIATNIANVGTANASGTTGANNAWQNALGNFVNNTGSALGNNFGSNWNFLGGSGATR